MWDFKLTVCDLETIMWLKRQKSYLQISMQTTSQTSFRQKRRGGNGGEEKAEREREIKSESWPNTLYSISRGRGRKKKVLLTWRKEIYMKTFLPGKHFFTFNLRGTERYCVNLLFQIDIKMEVSWPPAGDQMCYITWRIAMKWVIWSKKTPARTKKRADELLIKHSWWFQT